MIQYKVQQKYRLNLEEKIVMKKTRKYLSLIVSLPLMMANVFIVEAGNTPTRLSRSASQSKISAPATLANTQNGCFLYPTDDSLLRKYMKKSPKASDDTELPPAIIKKIKELIATGNQVIDMEKNTGKTGTFTLTFSKDRYSESDTAAITAFADKLLATRTDLRDIPPSTDITCRYPGFIINMYTTIHSDKLLSYQQQLRAIQMVFAGLKQQHKYMLDRNHTDRLLELDPNQITRLCFTLIRKPVGPILQMGDCAMLIEFPDVSILYTIR